MDVLAELGLVGLSHRTAPVSLRERVAVGPDELARRLERTAALPGVAEVSLLSTCNRTEVLVLARPGEDGLGAARQLLFAGIDGEALFEHRGIHAVMHVFRVASGLDSQVVGEGEILKQTRRAFEAARGAKASGATLDALGRAAVLVGKRVRRETPIGEGTLSVARVAVDLARHVFGDLADHSALVVGAGETGMLVARHLRSRGVGSLAFANRTPERAEAAAEELAGTAVPVEELGGRLPATDLVIACMDGGDALLRADGVERRALRRRDEPVVVIDLSVPRVVDPLLAGLDQVLVYDLDDLTPVVERHRAGRDEAGARATEILVEEVHKFLAQRTYAAFTPAIAGLRRRFDEVRGEVLGRITSGDPAPREIELAEALERRFLDLALDGLKEGARRSRSTEAVAREVQRFLERP